MAVCDEDTIRLTLKRLVDASGANFTADDIIREFRLPREGNSNRKLLTTLKIITKHIPTSRNHLIQVNKLLEKKDPFYCLVYFLNNLGEDCSRKDNVAHMLSSTKVVDTVTRDKVLEIKERVVQAATGGLSKSVQGSGYGCSTGSLLFPALNHNKSHVFWDFQKVDLIQFQHTNVAALPASSQETVLLHDLIYCLSGMRGTFIHPDGDYDSKFGNVEFKISEQLQSSLKDMAYEVIGLAAHYISIQRFVQRTMFVNCGQVLQALGAALRALIHDYYLLLAQLESELLNRSLTLHKLLFYIRPTLNTMEVVANAVNQICTADIKGGQALTLLYDRINLLTGDEEARKFLMQLNRLAAVPYMEMLQTWIQKGIIDDPQEEFLVEDNELIRREEVPEHYSADYWEKRYTIRRERVPRFLEKVSDIILRTGKYLNVIRQCGKKVKPPQISVLQFNPNNQHYTTIIQNAYHFASKNLLEVLLKENDLMGHLISVKRYLLLFQGDFIAQFMDACEEELDKNVDEVLPVKLENLLGLTLRLSSAKHDPYKDDLHCDLLTFDLATQMTKIMNNVEEHWENHDRIDLYGLECFAFRYDVKWPISLVLNHIAISKYQMLFRQLFYCKHVDRQLCKIWKENNAAKKFTPQAAELYRSAFTLRQRMMNALQNLEYYMMIEVVEPNWHNFIQKMNKVENVDDVLIVHQDFLDLCLKNCMITDPILLRSIVKLCNICLDFCEFIQKSQCLFLDAELSSMVCENEAEFSESETELYSCKQSESSLAPSDTFSERVKKFDSEFTGLLIAFLKQISDVASDNPSDRFINLVHRINFNSFYTDQLDKQSVETSVDKQL